MGMPQPDATPAEVLLARMSVALDRLTEEWKQLAKEMRERFESQDDVLRGHDGKNGVIGKLGHVERTALENRDDIADLRRQLREDAHAGDAASMTRAQTALAWTQAWSGVISLAIVALAALVKLLDYLNAGAVP